MVVKKTESKKATSVKKDDKKNVVKKTAEKKTSEKKASEKKTAEKKTANKKTTEKKKTLAKDAAKKETKSKTKVNIEKKEKTKKEGTKSSKSSKKEIFDPAYEPDSAIIDDESSGSEKEISFNNDWKEKDLEKELNKEDNIFDEDDDDEEEEDDEKTVLRRFEQQQEDIFEGVPIDDPVRMYLKEIGQYDLLTAEQEKKLAKEKQDAQDLLKKKKFEKTLKMTEEEAIKLPVKDARLIKLSPEELKVIQKGELSQEVLINRNLRLVVSIAKRYIGHGLSLLDLIQEGNLGLARGIEKFNYKMGFKLSTYVTWWIRQAVSRALADQSKTIRIPVHMVETINRLNKVKKKLTTKLGCEPTIKQIAKEMKMSKEKVEEVMQIALDPISLDKPVGDEDDSIVADFIADQNVISPEKYAEMVMLKEQIRGLLSTLKDRERKVLVLRFGIDDDRPRTLEEVGKELKVTRERIRQIEDKALRKLKFKAKNLQSYTES